MEASSVSWTIPRFLPLFTTHPVLMGLTVATILAMLYAVDIAVDLYKLRRVEQLTRQMEEDPDEV